MNTDHITATDLHRITTLEQRDGGISIEFADEPRDPWALAWLLLEIGAAVLVGASVLMFAGFVYAQRSIFLAALGW